MKKEGIFIIGIFVYFLLIIFSMKIITGETITGEVITGEVTSNSAAFNITVKGTLSLTLIKPENKTYLTNNSLLLNFTVSNHQAVWYNLDNGVNLTISSATYFNTSYGGHRLYLFANSSSGTVVTRNVNFTISHGFFNISYGNFSGANRGQSFDFNRYSFEELQNLSGMILENINYSRIRFNDIINLTDDNNHSDGVVNIDSYTNLSFNRIEIDSNYLPNFNKSATLVLYGLTFTNPRILFDGVACPASICVKNYYTNGELSFNVSHFTVYSTEETSSSSGGSSGTSSGGSSSGGGGSSGGGSGGGGGSIIGTTEVFSVVPSEFDLNMILGAKEEREIRIKKIGSGEIEIDIEVEGVENFIELSDSKLVLGQGEEVVFKLVIEALERGIHTGKIIFKSGNYEKEVFVLLNVESEKKLFDVSLTLLNDRKILRGETLEAYIALTPIGEISRVNVSISYIIKDFNGEEIYEESEDMFVSKVTNLERRFDTSELEAGEYVLGVEIVYPEGFSSAGQKFTIIEKLRFNFKLAFAIAFVLIVLFLIAVLTMIKIMKRKN